MNFSLSKFMEIAITALVIGTLVFGSGYLLVHTLSDDVAEYVDRSK